MTTRRKTSQPPTGAAESKVERKRVQNRIAQQHAREKQIARIRELESFVDRIRSAVDEEDAGEDDASFMEKNPKLTKTFLEVLDENAKLKQSLLRMRKSMISLSTHAADGAGDAIYEKLNFQADDREASETAESTAYLEITPSGLRKQEFQASSAHFGGSRQEFYESIVRDNITGQGSGTFPVITSSATVPTLTKASHHSRQCLDALSFSAADDLVPKPVGDLSQPIDPSLHCIETHIPEMSYNTESQLSFHEMMAHEILLQSNPSPQQNLLHDEAPFFQSYTNQPAEPHTEPQPSDLACSPGLSISSKSSSVMENFEQVLSIYISQMQQLTEALWKSLLAAAVRVLFSWTQLEEYAQCIGQGRLHESIVRWRLEPTSANREAIRRPFRPTDLQSIVICTTRYSPWLDFIPWPELRDQVLFRKDTIDAGDVLQDILENVVIELPHLGVAVFMRALFLETRKKIVTADFHDRQVSYEGDDKHRSLEFAVDTNMSIRTNFTPEELSMQPAAAIAQIKEEMDAEIDITSKRLDTSAATSAGSRHLDAGLVRELQAQFTAKYCISNTDKWKLSPAMAVKYPFMRTSSAQTRLPIISASVLVGC
ncbi:uncharacterized protein BDZ99DRAFT_181925 [Mytilinidion resinicola]|uniref:BZIP domain-containing protein n=1 Tax=Mytilinidion resinicola TaxID=574789 RepID=A0A6A6Z0H5_9PEZI|nr:uncharacterized protein BDZ99DRAFT_181925 [Mytilinidion resinicola]KAF2814666.1 hypothetical protein BDZ99DRAFT_181925 [Mytilinidion resinicola]